MYNQNLAPTTVQRTIRIPSGCLLFVRANREFVVVRFLPTELALAVFIKTGTYIHPFINLLNRERGVNGLNIASQSSSLLLFRTQFLFSNSKL
jgi:hypothetical protein